MIVIAVAVGLVVGLSGGALVAWGVAARFQRAGGTGVDGLTAGEAIRQAVDGQLGAELHRMGDLVGRLQQSQARAHGELATRLGETVRTARELGATTRRLEDALGNSRVRGQWGERMAEDALRVAGLVEGVNYVRQSTLDGGTRPDISVLLPEGRRLHLDVKFPVDQYLAALEARDERSRAEHEQAFVRAVRSHLKAVAGRGYADPTSTPGFAVVFIPNEAVYAAVMNLDPALVDVALRQGLVLCSPFTLFAVLAVVRQAVDAFRLGQASEEIIECLARFRSEWAKFADQLDRVERQFETAHRGLEDLVGTRRRQLERQLDRIDQIEAPAGDSASPRFTVVGETEIPGREVVIGQ
ncbi:MAG: DNA recombination protein RmuC [Acidimicrobiales bacterium]